mmetsp:Transcript_114621/g.331195  ORF Transcript_114621/g.331195 Transcript_114621/m.331195 type:complete len:306 (+) Transcript_114621:4977-5894(+)
MAPHSLGVQLDEEVTLEPRLLGLHADVAHVLGIVVFGDLRLGLVVAHVALAADLHARVHELVDDHKDHSADGYGLPKPGRDSAAATHLVLFHARADAAEGEEPLEEPRLRAMHAELAGNPRHAEVLGVDPPVADAARATRDVVAVAAAALALLLHVLHAAPGEKERPTNAAVPIVAPLVEEEAIIRSGGGGVKVGECVLQQLLLRRRGGLAKVVDEAVRVRRVPCERLGANHHYGPLLLHVQPAAHGGEKLLERVSLSVILWQCEGQQPTSLRTTRALEEARRPLRHALEERRDGLQVVRCHGEP